MKRLSFSKLFVFGVFVTLFLLPVSVFAATDVTDEVTLKQALANGETEINLKNDIVLSNDVGTHATRKVGLEVKGEGTITINGNGHKLSTSFTVATEVRTNTGKTVKVIFNDITIIGAERAIDTRSEGITLELNKTNLSVTKTGNYQALTIGGSAGPITVDINDNSVIDGGKYGYGIITFNPVNMTIDDSTVKGYAAIFMKPGDGSQGSSGSIVTITNSTIEGNSTSSGSDDNFATIALYDSDIEVNIVDSVIKATNTGTALQTPFLVKSSDDTTNDTNNTIIVEGNSEIIADTVTGVPLIGNYTSGLAEIIIKAGVNSNVEIKEEFLEEGTEVVVDDATGEITVVSKEKPVVDKTDSVKNPDTSDSIMILSVIAMISLIAITFSAKKLRRN